MKEQLCSAISGSHGFLGEHLVQYLERQEHKVIRLSRIGSETPKADYYFDLASYGNFFGQDDKVMIVGINVVRLAEMFLTTQSYDYKAFIVTSSSSVMLPVQTPYSEAKQKVEEMAKLTAEQFGKPVVIVRPFSVTGIGEQKEHLIPKLIDSCLYGTKMPFVRSPVHDFIDVEDLTEGIWMVAQHAQDYKGEVFEVGSGRQYTNKEVLEIVEKITGKEANIDLIKSMRPYDTKTWKADITKMTELGWKPKKTLEKSIQEMVEDYEQRITTKNP